MKTDEPITIQSGWQITKLRPAIFVYPVGTRCNIGTRIDAMVTAILIRENDNIQYEVGWWNGNEHQSKWLSACEICFDVDFKTKQIGFKP